MTKLTLSKMLLTCLMLFGITNLAQAACDLNKVAGTYGIGIESTAEGSQLGGVGSLILRNDGTLAINWIESFGAASFRIFADGTWEIRANCTFFGVYTSREGWVHILDGVAVDRSNTLHITVGSEADGLTWRGVAQRRKL